MDLRQLRYFIEIVEQGSLSRAGQRLHVAQPALSIHLRNMEAELGTPLLMRSRNGVRPTEAGDILLRHARLMLGEQTRVEDEIRNLAREPRGEVRLGMPGTISDILAVPLIEAATRLYPGIRLTVAEAMSGFVADWLQDGRVDLGVLYQHPEDPGLQATPLLREELLLISPPDGNSAPASFAELAAGRVILPSQAHGLRQMLDSRAAAAGLVLSPGLEVDSYNNIKILVARGAGISVLPRNAVEAERRNGTIAARPFAPPGLWRSVYLVGRTRGAATLTTALIHDLLTGLIADMVTDGDWAGAQPS